MRQSASAIVRAVVGAPDLIGDNAKSFRSPASRAMVRRKLAPLAA